MAVHFNLPHIVLQRPEEKPFTSISQMGASKRIPQRNRDSHAAFLQKQLTCAWEEAESEFVASHSDRHGVYLEFRGKPGFDLITKSLEELSSKKIRLCNVRTEKVPAINSETGVEEHSDVIYSTVFVSNDKRQYFSVGAYTQLTTLSDPTLAGYRPIAGVNQLSPFSTTSYSWEENKCPVKPDVVFKGCNAAVNGSGFVTECDDLSLLTTYYQPTERLFDSFNMTSAATAQAAHFAAKIMVQYPDYWPETVRALIVHSAEWPEALKRQFATDDKKGQIANVLKCCGYVVPDLNRALYCASNSLTMISQAEIQPYEQRGGRARTKDMHFYELPWPVEILRDLGELKIEMRITLSYFIEPGPDVNR